MHVNFDKQGVQHSDHNDRRSCPTWPHSVTITYCIGLLVLVLEILKKSFSSLSSEIRIHRISYLAGQVFQNVCRDKRKC